MYSHSGTLYPMLGVGAFVSMFWTGIVVGNELGLSCASLLIMGLLSGCIATVGVCELQRRDGHGPAAHAGGPATQHARARGEPAGRGKGKAGRAAAAGAAPVDMAPQPVEPMRAL